ncbi:ATP-binding protein [Spirillospora sp. NPDC052269]
MTTSPDIAGDAVDDKSARLAVAPRPAPARATGAGGASRSRAWALPGGPACPGYARAVLREALADLGVGRSEISDAQLMVSELATNAYQHAGDHAPHELWLYLADGPPGHGHEVRCAIFDRLPCDLPTYSWTSGDCGRGLSIVHELSEGRWGMLRTTSRLGSPSPGKAVWFAVPL